MRGYLILAALFVAAPASAQDSTTTCKRVFGTVQCDTEARQKPDFMGIVNAGKASVPDLQEQERASLENEALRADIARQREAARARQADYDLRDKVVARLKENDCAGASALALEGGNIELAAQAKAYCTTP